MIKIISEINEMITIRNAALEDAEHILKIYDHYVSNTAVSFEYVTTSLEEFQGRMRKFMKRYISSQMLQKALKSSRNRNTYFWIKMEENPICRS